LRTALGARRSDIVGMVFSDALRFVTTGMAIGVPLALACARLLRAQLHDVAPIDPGSIAVALLVLSTSATLASLLPALSAAKVSPLAALHRE
jgi:macrolide transport system ATP-binding/permease protein